MTHLALSAHRAIQVEQCSRQVAVKQACRKLTPNIHSSHNLNRPEAKRFRVKLANLKIPKIYLVKIFLDLREAENFKSKDLANEHPVFMPAEPVLSDAKPSPAKSVASEPTPYDHFQNLKTWIVGAYYSSEFGMRELGWTGMLFFENYPGCQHLDGHV
jgi:hypothetical protein